MPSRAEELLSKRLRPILAQLKDGESIPASDEFQYALEPLEYFIPEVLAELYAEWKRESLDGLYPLVARKVGDGEAEIFGLCILISDQTTTPIHLHLQVSSANEEISWMKCRLGEAGEHGMRRAKWRGYERRLHALAGRADSIEWVYKVTFGKKTV